MPDAVELTRFVENYLLQYGIDRDDYRIEVDEDHEWYSVAFPDGVISNEAIEHILLITGLTREELFGMKKETLDKYSKKFPFFELDEEFNSKYAAESRYLNVEKIAGLFYMGTVDRYDVTDLKKRIIRKAIEVDDFVEGTYHPDAIPVGLRYSTEWMISFPKYGEMITSLFNMINRYKNLFVRAIKTELENEDIREMNFLASALDSRDLVMQDVQLYYHNVLKFREIYKEEKLNDFFSYVKIGRMKKTKYWRCDEFLNNKALVQLYLRAYPEAISEMNKYIMRTNHFSCWFYWSDNVPDEWKEYFPVQNVPDEHPEEEIKESRETSHERYIMSLSDEEYEEHQFIESQTKDMEDYFDYPEDLAQEEELEEEIKAKAEAEDYLGIAYFPPDDEWPASENNDKQVHLYIDKLPEEQYFNASYYEQIKKAILPEAKGGLPFPKRECVSDKLMLNDGQLFDRRMARMQALMGGA